MIHMLALGKSEVRLLQTLQREEKTGITGLAEKMALSISRASELVGSLKEKGFVEVERRKKQKLVFFASNKHAQLTEDLLGRFDYMDFSNLLSGGALGVLYALEEEQSVKDIADALGAYRASTHRILKRFMERGVVKKRNARYSLNPDFKGLNEIAREAMYYLRRKRVQELSLGAAIVWEGFQEFIARAPGARESGGFRLTGPSKLGDYGVPLIAPKADYYFYSERKERIDLYDVIVHTLLIDPKSTRYITYLLIVLVKSGADEKSLRERAKAYGVAGEAGALLNFIKEKGRIKRKHFPSWSEFKKKALNYGVEV